MVPSLSLTLYHPVLATPIFSTASFFLIYPITLYLVEPPLLTFNPVVATSFLELVVELFDGFYIYFIMILYHYFYGNSTVIKLFIKIIKKIAHKGDFRFIFYIKSIKVMSFLF